MPEKNGNAKSTHEAEHKTGTRGRHLLGYNEPLIDSTPLGKAESYGGHKIHPGDHCTAWETLQRTGLAPADTDYAEMPRGRVMFNCKEQRFSFLADACILSNKGVVRRIMKAMHLPPGNVKTETDPHYRCYACLGWTL